MATISPIIILSRPVLPSGLNDHNRGHRIEEPAALLSRLNMHRPFLILAALSVLPMFGLRAQEPGDTYAKRVAKGSDEGRKAIQRIQAPSGLKVDLWAAEPML